MKKTYFIWAIFILLYLTFIWLFTYFYPLSEDELICNPYNWACSVKIFTTSCARIGTFIIYILLNGYKWSFLILNPIMQLSLVFSIFYFVNLRFPDFKTLKDFPQFIFTALACVFLVARPDQTIFWLSGSANYLFLGVMFIMFCALMRKTWHEPNLIPSNFFTCSLAILAGIILGMNNENSAPMIFCLCCLYTLLSLILKKKIPVWFWFLFTGIILGLSIMFSSPVYHARMDVALLKVNPQKSLSTRILFFINHIDYFMRVSFYALPIIILLSFILLTDKFKTAIKSEAFLFTALCCFVSLVLAAVFFIIPFHPKRTFYNANLFTIISILFFIKYVKETYHINLMPLFFFCILCFTAVIFIPFAKPYISLYKQDMQRQVLLEKFLANKNENFSLWLPAYYIDKGPTDNLSIKFYDPMIGTNGQHIFFDRYYERDFVSGTELSYNNLDNIMKKRI